MVDFEPKVIYGDKDFIAVYKPAGLLVHRTSEKRKEKSEELTLVDWLLRKYPEIKFVGDDPKTRPGVVHRLDRDTSGVMLVARNQKYFEYLKSLFQNHLIQKKYLALVLGKVKKRSDEIVKPISIKGGTIKRTVYAGRELKEAETHYRLLKLLYKEGRDFSLLEISPTTGRTHQIRVHLASIGHPVLGDKIYGPKTQPAWAKRLFLHALSLEFAAQPGRRLKIESEPPPEFDF